MAKVISKQQVVRTRYLGSDSTGRLEVSGVVWTVEVLDDNNRLHDLEFPSNPTDQQVIDALPHPADLIPTIKVDLEVYMRARYEDWLLWRTTRLEAQTQGMVAAVVTALQDKENATWLAYVEAINAWRTAP